MKKRLLLTKDVFLTLDQKALPFDPKSQFRIVILLYIYVETIVLSIPDKLMAEQVYNLSLFG